VGLQLLDHIGVRGGDVLGFGKVVVEMVKLGCGHLSGLVFGGDAASAAGASGEGAVTVGEDQFPLAVAGDDGLELVLGVIKGVVGVRVRLWFQGR
jgi:hypothetical protein